MTRPCAKYARLNCEHRQKIPTAKRRRIFLCRLVHIHAARSIFGLGSTTGRQGAMKLRAPKKIPTAKTPSDIFYVGLLTYAWRGLIWGLVYVVTKYKRAVIARFLSVAKGNISRLRDAQAFHAAVKRPPYFTFARQRRHLTAGHNLPGFLICPLRGLFLGVVLCRYKYKRAVIARFRNVAEGNISRLRDAQAFHTAVKWPPYFTFARQRRHFTAGAACPACAVYFLARFYVVTSISAR